MEIFNIYKVNYARVKVTAHDSFTDAIHIVYNNGYKTNHHYIVDDQHYECVFECVDDYTEGCFTINNITT